MILNSEGNNIFQVCLDTSFLPFESEFCRVNNEIPFQWKIIFPFQSLSPEDYRQVMNVVESAILSTDLAMYFKKRDRFLDLIDNGEFDWQSDEKKERTLIGILLQIKRQCPVFDICSSLWDDDDSLRRECNCEAMGGTT